MQLSYRHRSISIDSSLSHQPLSWFKTVCRGFKTYKHHKRNKSEKSVHSQTEINRLSCNNDSAIQCSERSLQMESTRNSLFNLYIQDVSDNSLSKSDIREIENQKKLFYKPMKILTQIIHDVMCYFPEIESTFIELFEWYLNEILVKHIKLQAMNLKRIISVENLKSVNEFHSKLQQPGSGFIHSPLTYDYGQSLTYENQIENNSFGDTYGCEQNQYINLHHESLNSNRTIQHHFYKRYVVKQYRNTEKKIEGRLLLENVKEMKGDCITDLTDSSSFNGDIPTNRTLPINRLGDFMNSCNIKGRFIDKLCTISVSPAPFSTTYGRINNTTVSESLNNDPFISTEIINESVSYLRNNYRMIESTKGMGEIGGINEHCFISKDDEHRELSRYAQDDYSSGRKYVQNSHQYPMSSKDNSSINLDFMVFPGSDHHPTERKPDECESQKNMEIEEQSFKSRLGSCDTPIQVSVMNSSDNGCRQQQREQHQSNWRYCFPIAHGNDEFQSPMRLNLFCESLYEKYDLKYSDNVCQCDTDMSVAKHADQTISLSNHSNEICEVVTGRCGGDRCQENMPKRSNRLSVKFIENLSKEMRHKTHLKSSILRHTIASKLKMRNPKNVHHKNARSIDILSH